METNGRRYLDRGAQGRVYHLEEQNIVLKKSINWKNSRLYDLAKNECRLLQELRHQNIVHFVDCEEREVPNENIVVFYLKMEYCCHGSLKRVLKNPTFIYSVATIVSWMENIFSALAFLAEHHKIHRDIKADNIMVDASFTLKLGDFGSVKETEKTAFDSIFGGTPGYMAPEVCKERKFSHRSDIFSVGKVLKEIVERRLLHEDKSSSNFGTSKDLDFVLTVCPKEIKELITCCTKENYQQRKSAAELLLEIPILRKLFSSFPSIAVDIKETILWLPIGLNGENDRHAVYKDENFYVPSVSSFPLNLPAFEEYDDPRNVIYEITLAAKNEKEILSFAKSLSLDTMIPQFYYPHKIRKDIERFLNSLATDLRFQFPFSNRILDFHNTENVKLQSLVSQMDEKNLESFASNLQMLIDGAKNLQYVYSYDYVSQKNFDLYTEMIDENLAAEFTDFSAESFKIPDFQIPDFLNVSQINDGKSDENLTYEYVAKQLDHILRRDYATQHFVYSSIFETLLELNSAELNSTEFIQPWVKFRSLKRSLENLEELKKIFTKNFYFYLFSEENSKAEYLLISAHNFLFINKEFTVVKKILGDWDPDNPLKFVARDRILLSKDVYHLTFNDLKKGLQRNIEELKKKFQKKYKTKRFARENLSNFIFRLNRAPKFICTCSPKCELISGIPKNYPQSFQFIYPTCSSNEFREYLDLYTLFLKSFDYLQKWNTDLSFSINSIKELIIEMEKTRKCTNYFLFLTHSNEEKRKIYRIFLDFPENSLNFSYNVKFLNKAFQIRTRSVINFKNDYKLYYVISTEMIIHLLQEEISCFQEEEKGRRKVEEKAPEHTDLAGDKAHEAKESTKETTKQYAQQAGRKLSNAAEKPPEMLKNFEDFWRNLQLHDLNGQKKRIK